MNERTREATLALVVVLLLAAAVALDLGSGAARESSVPEAAAPFVGRAVFCSAQIDHEDTSGRVTVSSGLERGGVAVEPEPARPPTASTLVWSGPLGARAQAVEGRGAPAYAGTSLRLSSSKERGAAAARCSPEASSDWYFAAGTTAIGHDERLLLHNPFPEEAVVRITLFTQVSDIVKSGLSDVAVPAGGTQEVKLNRVVVPRSLLGVEVSAVRGRVVAWKSVIARPREGARGLSFSLGATEAASRWFFAHGFTGPGVTESISVLNPSDRELTVTVSLAAEDRAAQPARLMDVSIPPRSARRLILREGILAGSAKRVRGISATVASTNGVEFIAEREVSYEGDLGEGVTAELGAAAPARSWLLTPPVSDSEDDSIAILNPTARDGRVDVFLRGERGVSRPASLQGLKIGAGLRLEVPLSRWTSSSPPVVALLASDVELVAERYAHSRRVPDWADVMGFPLPEG
ncbi:MAG: DUF5719 family protein [Actinomycetota bacterium]|nr:DUF5719 family protein [Actinomycetota bacterium]